MPGTLDKFTVIQRLADLDRRDPQRKVFGAKVHDYRLRPTVPISVIESFEKQYGISLPHDYRSFITEIGDGGAGPFYGLLPFGKDDTDCDWHSSSLVGDLSKPFPHTGAWNLPASFWSCLPDPSPDTPLEEEDRLMNAWDRELEAHYWNPTIMNGAIPICHQGCALRQWLVVHGEQTGFVWNDLRADSRGIAPVLDQSGNPVKFTDWYMEWLEDSLQKVGESQC